MQNNSNTVLEPEKEPAGVILHLEKMALFDGEGMRTVVFLKGCPLRCQWCSTPESQSPAPQLGYDPDKCTGCLTCVDVCPQQAIHPSETGELVETDSQACNCCFACVEACPSKARKQYGRKVSAQRIVEELEKDDVFYFHSGGGITLSGGEPLTQSEFAKAILAGCRERGLHTAIETSGYVSWERFMDVLPLLDSVLIDIKALDPERHKELTGHSNELIIDNIKRIDRSEFPVDLFIRIPLIPGINDDDTNMAATAKFCKSLRKFKELHVLPYHKLGVESYRFLARDYPLKALETPNAKLVEEKAKMLRQQGIAVKIGG